MIKSFIQNLFILSLVLLCLTFCTKKAFKNIKVKGRLIHFFTKQPLSSDVFIVSDNNFSGRSKSIDIGSDATSSEGYFSIKGRASKQNSYYLNIPDESEMRKIDLKEGQTNDLGEIYSGSHVFFCRVTLIPDSGKCLQFYGNSILNFPAGTQTTFVYSIVKHWNDPVLSFPVSYITFNCNNNPASKLIYSTGLPISGTDTLHYTIRY